MNINKIFPFKFWCQKVIPLVFDDSLSYYETLCKISDKLNEVIEQNNLMGETINNQNEIIENFITQVTEEIQGISDNLDEKFDELSEELKEYLKSDVFKKEIYNYISSLQSAINTPYLQVNSDVPSYMEIGDNQQSVYMYENLIGKYDTINIKNGATLEKIKWNDEGDEEGNILYYYEIKPTIYNKTRVVVGGDHDGMSTGEVTYIQQHTDNTIILSAGIHGNERQSINALYAVTKYICESDNPTAIYLRNNIHFVIVPCVNAWGYRRNLRLTANGVDVNRNFPTSNWEEYESTEKGSEPLSSRSALFLYEILNKYVSTTSVNGTVYIDYHDFEGGANDTVGMNSFATANNIELREQIGKTYTHVYNIMETMYNVIQSDKPFRILNFGTIPGAGNWAIENGLYFSALMECRTLLNRVSPKYTKESSDLSWHFLANVVIHSVSILVGRKLPFDNVVRLLDIGASKDDSIFEIAKKLPRFQRLTMAVLSLRDKDTNLGHSLPTYDEQSGVLRTSIVTIDKTITDGEECIITVYDIYGTTTHRTVYIAHMRYDGVIAPFYKIDLHPID